MLVSCSLDWMEKTVREVQRHEHWYFCSLALGHNRQLQAHKPASHPPWQQSKQHVEKNALLQVLALLEIASVAAYQSFPIDHQIHVSNLLLLCQTCPYCDLVSPHCVAQLQNWFSWEGTHSLKLMRGSDSFQQHFGGALCMPIPKRGSQVHSLLQVLQVRRLVSFCNKLTSMKLIPQDFYTKTLTFDISLQLHKWQDTIRLSAGDWMALARA